MIFIESHAFTEDIVSLMPDELYAQLQQHLAQHPDAGDTVSETGGMRKVRWKLPGTGKRGGVRIIYYWRVAEDQMLMLLVYAKAKTENLTAPQKRMLKQAVENW